MLAAAAVGLAGGAPPQARTRRWADGGCSIQVLAPLALDAGSRLGALLPCLAASPLLEHAVALAAGRRSCCPAPVRIAAKRRPRCSVPTHHGGGVSEEKVADIRLGGDPGASSPRLATLAVCSDLRGGDHCRQAADLVATPGTSPSAQIHPNSSNEGTP
ncbi:unnamed protein product [Miscanthus lutarioriparius]|uniref:Uncharacterized protein n=1 Tax=Miscanthus lutarioriparius TaxID=422564 RepID=A0A811SEM5_9POAL|nr:unnamed protein product [Miscanthus lutarioriparius]